MKSVLACIEDCSKEDQVKEKELISVGKSIVKWSEEIELKKKQLSKGQETNKQQLDLIQTLTATYTIGGKEKEKHLDSLKKDLEDRVQDLEIKERI